MSHRAEWFLEHWVDAFVRPAGSADLVEEAQRLAARCLAEAAQEGIAPEEVQEAAGGDLVGYVICFVAESAD